MKLNSAGQVSASILSRAGTGIQEECDEKFPNGIKHLQVAITSGYTLPYSLVFHCTVAYISNQNCFTEISKLIKRCLFEADGKIVLKHNGQYSAAKSIAFPLLGTGAKTFPDEICRTFYRTILSFLLGPRKSLENAYIIVTPRDQHLIKVIQTLKPLAEFNQMTYELSYPYQWQETNDNLNVINIPTDTEEYMLIKEEFTNFGGPYKAQILKIERIQNKALYKEYLKSKCQYKLLQKKNERQLWMYCDDRNITTINSNGLDSNHMKVGRNGHGYYFYTTSAGADDVADHTIRNRKMYYCSVLVGQPIIGDQSYNATNFLTTGISAVDNTAQPSIYTIYKENLLCPNYLISYAIN